MNVWFVYNLTSINISVGSNLQSEFFGFFLYQCCNSSLLTVAFPVYEQVNKFSNNGSTSWLGNYTTSSSRKCSLAFESANLPVFLLFKGQSPVHKASLFARFGRGLFIVRSLPSVFCREAGFMTWTCDLQVTVFLLFMFFNLTCLLR